MPMSSGLSSEGRSSSRAPKAPRSRARLRAQQVAENAQVEAKKSESVQAESAQSQLTQPQATQPQVVKSTEATGTAKPSEAMKSVEAVKPVEAASLEASNADFLARSLPLPSLPLLSLRAPFDTCRVSRWCISRTARTVLILRRPRALRRFILRHSL